MTARGAAAGSRPCPYCAETIRAEAVVCRYCGRDVAFAGTHVALRPKKKHLGPRSAIAVVLVGLGACLCLSALIAGVPLAPGPVAYPDATAARRTATPAPTRTPTPIPPGKTRDHPVPAGDLVDLDGFIRLVVVDAIRPADSIVARGNMFNSSPESGDEYVAVGLELYCDRPPEKTCSFYASALEAVGADGNVRDAEWSVFGVEGQLDSGEFFGGATRSGYLFFIVPQDDPTVVLFHEPLLFGDPVYFALP